MKQSTVNETINSIWNNYASIWNKSTVNETNLPVNETTVYETIKFELHSKRNKIVFEWALNCEVSSTPADYGRPL